MNSLDFVTCLASLVLNLHNFRFRRIIWRGILTLVCNLHTHIANWSIFNSQAIFGYCVTSYLFITIDIYEEWHENRFKCHLKTVCSFIQTLKFLVLNQISASPITKVMSITLQGSDIWVYLVKFESLYFIRIIFFKPQSFLFLINCAHFIFFYTASIMTFCRPDRSYPFQFHSKKRFNTLNFPKASIGYPI